MLLALFVPRRNRCWLIPTTKVGQQQRCSFQPWSSDQVHQIVVNYSISSPFSRSTWSKLFKYFNLVFSIFSSTLNWFEFTGNVTWHSDKCTNRVEWETSLNLAMVVSLTQFIDITPRLQSRLGIETFFRDDPGQFSIANCPRLDLQISFYKGSAERRTLSIKVS